MSRQPLQGPPSYAIGIDVGGTKCAAGLVEFPTGRVISRRLQPTRPERGGEAVLADVVQIARSLREEAGEFAFSAAAIGVGVAELVTVDGHIVSEATIRWRDADVHEVLRAATGLPVTIDADVRAAARAEAQFGAGRPFASFLYVTVGTGISASLVLEGVPYTGSRGLAGSFASSGGLIPLDSGRLATGPALEQFASGPAIAARFAATRPEFKGMTSEVVSLAEAGDSVARDVVATSAHALGAAIGQLVNVLDPEAILVGGGLGLVEGMFRHEVDAALRNHIWSDLHRGIPLLSAELENDAGFIGAAWGAMATIRP